MNMQFLLNASPQNTQDETIFSVNIAGKTYINASGSDQKIEMQGISFKIKPSNIIINTLKNTKLISLGNELILHKYNTFATKKDQAKFEALSVLFPNAKIITNTNIF